MPSSTIGANTLVNSPRSDNLRIALLPWMVAGVRTQYENLRAAEPPLNCVIDTFPIVPYKRGGVIEALPLLQPSQKGTIRSTTHTLPLLTRRDYDVVWTQALLPLLPFMTVKGARKNGRPAIVYTIDTTPALMDDFTPIYYGVPAAGPAKRRLRDALFRYALRRCTVVTPWSQWAARSFVRDYGVAEDRIYVIPPGVDLAAWSPSHHREAASERETRPFRLLFVGADFERKGGPLLLDVFRHSLRDRCELHLVTKAPVAESEGVHVYREFGPNEPGLRDLYSTCDALILPTRADCFSLASIEAMACGLPVVSCPVGGIPEIVQHGETGLLVPPDDGASLLAAVQALLDNPAQGARMGHAGRRLVEQRFDNARTSAALLDVVCRLGARRSAR